MIKKILVFLFIQLTMLSANTITIAVAANVSYAIDELKDEFIKLHKDIDVRVILGSSGKLTAQIKHGAPYDLFMSANMDYPNSLYDDKFALFKPVVYAKGSLALLSSKKRDFSSSLEILKKDEIKKIAVANPKTAPYGIATKEALENSNLLKSISKKFVYGESIGQTLSFTISATDIGFVALSSLYSKKLAHFKKGENWIEVDSKLYKQIEQGMVLLKDDDAVRAFYEFVLSDKGRDILKNYGYSLPKI